MSKENSTELLNQNEIDLFERFWSKVDIPDNLDGCWNWKAYKVPKTKRNRLGGYGQIRIHGETHLSHRIAYQLAVGQIPENMFVLHECDNPSCCNPNHLKVGDQVLNMKDMWSHGRAKPGHVFGIKHGCAKLNEQDITEIRILSECLYSDEIARMYGVSGRNIRYIIGGQHWKHMVRDPSITVKLVVEK